MLICLQFTKQYFVLLPLTKHSAMPTYIFRILENGQTYKSTVTCLIEKHKGTCNAVDTKEGFIYETEFETNESLQEFRAELTEMLPYS